MIAESGARTIDEQMQLVTATSELAETLAAMSGDFERFSRAAIDGLPTLIDHQARLSDLLQRLIVTGEDLRLTVVVERDSLDAFITSGRNVSRLLFDHRIELAQTVQGLRDYGRNFVPGFTHPDVQGATGRFAVIIDVNSAPGRLCTGFPPELSSQIPGCEDGQGSPLPIDLPPILTEAQPAAGAGDLSAVLPPVPEVPQVVEEPAG